MPAEQRIIGGGLLIAGIAIVLILLYLFKVSGPTPQEAKEELLKQIYPAFLEAEKDADYLKVKRHAEEALETLEAGGRAAVVKLLQADASTGDKDATRLRERIVKGELEKNAEGRFEFSGGWYGESDHRSLVALGAALEDLKLLRRVRETAQAARTAIDEARLGSGLPLELPAAKLVPRDDAPIVDPNPVYASDSELYRIFGLKAAEVDKALASKTPGGGKARSARLRWNQKVSGSDLGADVESIPEWAETLRRIATDFERSAGSLASSEEAKEELGKMLSQAASILGAGLDEPHRSTFTARRARFETGPAIATVLRREEEMLSPYLPTVRDLGGTFRKTFDN